MRYMSLCEICTPKQWPTLTLKQLSGKGFPVYGANGIIGYHDIYNHEQATVMIGCRGTCGQVTISEEKAYINGNAMCLDNLSDSYDKKFILYYLQNYDFSEIITGSSQPQITRESLKKVLIPIVSKEVQQKVVSHFDKLYELIVARKLQLTKLDQLVKSRFIELFGDPVENNHGWQTQPLDDICKTIVDCPHSTPSYTNENTGFMCIRTSLVKKNRILWDDIEYIPEHEYYKRIQRKRPEKGDIVYTREGAILGIAAMIDRDCNVALGQRSMLLSPDTTKCVPQFLSVAMNFETFLRKALGGISGSASPHINVGDIKAFDIILPPLELQKQFAAFVEQTDKSKLSIQQSLDKLELLKKSLMQEYFG